MRGKLFILLTAIAILWSCGNSNEHASYAPTPEQGWLYGDTIFFDDIAADTSATVQVAGNLQVALRHLNTYPYRNLWLEVAYVSADNKVHTDTVEVELCDVYGRWFGKGVGSLYQASKIVNPEVTLKTGSRVGVRHIMRVDTLRGIERVGVHFIPSDTES